LKPPFEILEHPSDLGIEARGATMAEAFQNAAHGLMSIIAGSSKIKPCDKRSISIVALDRENLLVRWLSEVLYLYDAEKFLSADFKFETLTDTSLQATILGQQASTSSHELILDVKAITYHNLKVQKLEEFWIVRVYLDI
jgi:SHS2 domain-containing protein